jgi:hypothetical protein
MALFEYRVYEAVPGKLPALHRRFETMTLGHFQRHGIGVVGFWDVLVGTSNELHYILRFDDMAHRDKAWGGVSGRRSLAARSRRNRARRPARSPGAQPVLARDRLFTAQVMCQLDPSGDPLWANPRDAHVTPRMTRA